MSDEIPWPDPDVPRVEEWPVTPNFTDQALPLRPVVLHPLFGYNWDVRCPHCGGGVKVFSDGAPYATNGFCWECERYGLLVLPPNVRYG